MKKSVNRNPTIPTGLQRWVSAFCIIRFDLEQGQVVEDCFPPESISPEILLQVAFSSFPDSTSHHLHPSRGRSSIHDSIFFFRLPCSGCSFLYGFVFNRRRQDERLPRGGEQKSVVILSRSPFSSVFKPLLQILAPLCFDLGRSALELVASHVATWPTPVTGEQMDLPIGSSLLRAYLPDDYSEIALHLTASSSLLPHGLFHDSDLFASFRGLLLHLWTLWELIVIGEPILVVGITPPQCSEAVAALVSLVSPLLPAVDFRPYFTIHDPDFARLNSIAEGDEFPPMILGVTNLFFLKALRNIKHVVSVGSPVSNSAKVNLAAAQSSSNGNAKNSPLARLKLEQLSLNRFSPSSLLNAVKLRREGPLSLMTEHKEALWSSYGAITKPDTSVLNRLVDAGSSSRVEESMSVVNNEILRRHFLELTTNFLAPFGPYLRATTPSERSSLQKDPPPLTSFHADEFLSSLAARGPGKFLSKRMKSNWLDLYRRFLRGHNFMPWFQGRSAAAEQEQQRLWRQAQIDAQI